MFKGLQRLYATPIDGEHLELRGVVTLQVAEGLETGTEFVDVIAESVFEQWDNDIDVWDTKRYLPKPLVNRSESLIPVYRRWYQQFYRPVRNVDEPRQRSGRDGVRTHPPHQTRLGSSRSEFAGR